MAERVCIVSHESTFAQMLRLELEDAGFSVSVVHREKHLPSAGVYLVDRDVFSASFPTGASVIGYGRKEGRDPLFLARPFSVGAMLSAVRGEKPKTGLVLLPDGCAVLLDGAHIPLTQKEYALLACLVRAEGAPVSRASLLSEVWGEEADEGVVTVYVHYLRNKLERGGKKLLRSVRGSGYALRMEEIG